MLFIILLIAITLSIAGSAAFFSIYGLAQIFSGSFLPVVIMASSLEAGKLIAASYVYRFWNRISWFLKTYLLIAIFVLMSITSLGIFGYLSAAYQKDVLPLAEIQTKVGLLTQKITNLENLRSEERVQLQRLQDNKSKEIANLPANYATKKAQVAQRYADRIARIEENINGYTTQIRAATEERDELRLSTLQQELKTGPIVFIAQALGYEVNDATKWLILIIIIAFDPLAVALTIGANIALVERQAHKRRRDDDMVDPTEHIDEPDPTITTVDQLLESKDPPSIDQIKHAIEEISKHEDPSPEELVQRGMLEEMLRRKIVTQKTRTSSSPSK